MGVDQLEGLVGGGFDDFDEGVGVDLAADEHLLQLALDVKRVQDALAQVLVLLHADGELSLLLVHAGDLDLLPLDRLRELEVHKVRPDLLVVQARTHHFGVGLSYCSRKLLT